MTKAKKSSYTQFKGIHQGDVCLITALGASIDQLKKDIADKYICIGVNDVYKLGFHPKYLVLLDLLKADGDYGNLQKKVKCITETESEYAFCLYHFDFKYAKCISIKADNLVNTTPKDIMNRGNLFMYNTSTITAISLAIYMGFKQVGILGFDLKGHDLEKNQVNINKYCDLINDYAMEQGTEILNLSKDSLVESFNKATLTEFIDWYGYSTAI